MTVKLHELKHPFSTIDVRRLKIRARRGRARDYYVIIERLCLHISKCSVRAIRLCVRHCFRFFDSCYVIIPIGQL